MTIKSDFPALSKTVNGRTVCYLDSAASAQKPKQVIEAMNRVMQEHYANVHRGVYTFGSLTSTAFENARAKVAKFLNAASEKEIVFTRNSTEAINLVAATFGETLQAGDEIILTELEHHANIVPWWMLAQKKGVVIKVLPIREGGALDLAQFDKLLSPKTKLLAVTHMSNALGTINPVARMADKARAVGAKVLIDGSQAVVHVPVDVQDIGADFYVFTGHKLYGPSGIGVLWGRYDVLNSLPPYQGGGEMIELVSFDTVTFKEAPYRFEAGTPPIVEAIGLGAAIDYYTSLDKVVPAQAGILSGTGTLDPRQYAAHIGMAGADKKVIHLHEALLLADAETRLAAIPGVKIYSRAPMRAAILNFTLDGIHPHDAATIFDQLGVAVRAGHHCTQPLMKALGVTATLRASFAAYNNSDDVARLEEAVLKARKMLA